MPEPRLTDLVWDDVDGVWEVKEIDGMRVALLPLAFTYAIIIGWPRDFGSFYTDRWCYHDAHAALTAAIAWEGPYPGSEPTGWHRHPTTGRRRENGDPAKEEIYQ